MAAGWRGRARGGAGGGAVALTVCQHSLHTAPSPGPRGQVLTVETLAEHTLPQFPHTGSGDYGGDQVSAGEDAGPAGCAGAGFSPAGVDRASVSHSCSVNTALAKSRVRGGAKAWGSSGKVVNKEATAA